MVVSLCGLAYYIWRIEAYRHTVVYVWSTTLLTISTIILVTRRPLVAVLLVTAVVALIRVIAVGKHRKMNMTLHAYDSPFTSHLGRRSRSCGRTFDYTLLLL